eukprot:6770545-Prymnesium_polylepis.1
MDTMCKGCCHGTFGELTYVPVHERTGGVLRVYGCERVGRKVRVHDVCMVHSVLLHGSRSKNGS